MTFSLLILVKMVNGPLNEGAHEFFIVLIERGGGKNYLYLR